MIKVKIIDQVKEMDIDLFENIVNNFLKDIQRVVHVNVKTEKSGLLRATIIYEVIKRPNINDEIGNKA